MIFRTQFFLLHFLKLCLNFSLYFITFSHTQQVLYFIIQKYVKMPLGILMFRQQKLNDKDIMILGLKVFVFVGKFRAMLSSGIFMVLNSEPLSSSAWTPNNVRVNMSVHHTAQYKTEGVRHTSLGLTNHLYRHLGKPTGERQRPCQLIKPT